jgi:phosphatidylethanolamine/phosphatidyl-N-methylethanolamine N-methyltransferase
MANKLIAAVTDSSLFLREWITNPKRTGAVAPSSPQLAGAMAAWLPADPECYVLELGPGTGSVTAALLKHGLREDRLIAIEHNPALAGLLRKRHPRATIIAGDAWHLDDLLPACTPPVHGVGAVISSLPLLNFSMEQAEALAQKIQAVLLPQGHWVQFSYNLRNKYVRGAGRFRLHASKIIWLNLPPARVSVYARPARTEPDSKS